MAVEHLRSSQIYIVPLSDWSFGLQFKRVATKLLVDHLTLKKYHDRDTIVRAGVAEN